MMTSITVLVVAGLICTGYGLWATGKVNHILPWMDKVIAIIRTPQFILFSGVVLLIIGVALGIDMWITHLFDQKPRG